MKKMLFAILAGSTLILTACGGDDTSDVYSDDMEITLSEEEVKNVYRQNCSSCHGQILADGLPGDLAGIGSELTAEEIDRVIRKGTGLMQGGLVKGEEKAAIVQWLSTMK